MLKPKRAEQASIPISSRPRLRSTTEPHGIRGGSRGEDPDAILVERLKLQLPEAYDLLFGAYKKRLMGVAFRLTKCTEDAEDVVQNTFLQVFRSVERFRGDCRFFTWITAIAINQALMALRRKKRSTVSLDAGFEFEEHVIFHAIRAHEWTPEETCLGRELEEMLIGFVTKIRKTNRCVFEMHVAEELSVGEIAQRLGITVAATKSRLLRARMDIRFRAKKHYQPTRFERLSRTALSEAEENRVRPGLTDRIGNEMTMDWHSIAS